MTEFMVQAQPTPNPFAMKFICSGDLIAEGKATFSELKSIEHVPLVSGLLELPNVTQVHLFENVATVTQNGASDWEALETAVVNWLQKAYDGHDKKFFKEMSAKTTERPPLTEELQEIDEILSRTVRPYLQNDGGDLQLVSLKDKVLTIEYEGACGSCPSATMGTLQAIESVLKDEYDDQIVVVTM